MGRGWKLRFQARYVVEGMIHALASQYVSVFRTLVVSFQAIAICMSLAQFAVTAISLRCFRTIFGSSQDSNCQFLELGFRARDVQDLGLETFRTSCAKHSPRAEPYCNPPSNQLIERQTITEPVLGHFRSKIGPEMVSNCNPSDASNC